MFRRNGILASLSVGVHCRGTDRSTQRDDTDHEGDLTIVDMLGHERFKSGLVKCRLLHMDGRSVVQPDVLLRSSILGNRFYIPKFFDPNQIGFFSDARNDFCRFSMVTQNEVVLRIGFFARDRVRTCADGSVIYKCHFSRLGGEGPPKASGSWREQAGRYQLKLFHHTNQTGYDGINASGVIWGSRRNIQGTRWLKNIAYGYFTSLEKIRTERDLSEIAMSSSGLTGFVPTNAPYHPAYASVLPIPLQTAADRARTLALWVDCELLAPNHLWLHKPMNEPAYYEIVLPKVFRVGLAQGAEIQIVDNQVRVAEVARRNFAYVIVGDADTHAGLQAPFHEEETVEVAAVEQLRNDQEIVECWKRLANTNQFDHRDLEYAQFSVPSFESGKA